jgi:ribose/xylose/arabinose/galactoside ABC-type transport system permease subunit
MNLLNIASYTQQIVLDVVILLAVVLDELRKRYLLAR